LEACFFDIKVECLSEEDGSLNLADAGQQAEFDKAIVPAKQVIKDSFEKITEGLDIDKSKFFITGGCLPNLVRYYMEQDTIGKTQFPYYVRTDFDVFIIAKDKEELETIVDPILKKFNKNMRTLSKPQYDIFDGVSKNSYIIPEVLPEHFSYVNIIHVVYGEPQDVINSFDMEHVKGIYLPETDKIVITQKTIDAIKHKLLITYEGNHIGVKEKTIKTTPLRVGMNAHLGEERVYKWQNRGWKIY